SATRSARPAAGRPAYATSEREWEGEPQAGALRRACQLVRRRVEAPRAPPEARGEARVEREVASVVVEVVRGAAAVGPDAALAPPVHLVDVRLECLGPDLDATKAPAV